MITKVKNRKDKWCYIWRPHQNLNPSLSWLRENFGDWGYVNYQRDGYYEFVFYLKCHLEWFILKWGDQ